MNALLDYGSSSSGDSENESDTEQRNEEEQSKTVKLPKPSLDTSSLQTSVFSNPFVEAELAKAAILEKHVKMVPGKDNTQMINGKKICWSYRKGKCRFGHNCKYAHDTDIQKTQEELDAEKQLQKQNAIVCEGAGSITSAPPPQEVLPTDDEVWEGSQEKRKKRPGLSTGLVPGKKVLKMYKDQKLRDTK